MHHYTGKFINYNAFRQLMDVVPIIVLAIFASSMIYLIDTYGLKDLPDIFRILIWYIRRLDYLF